MRNEESQVVTLFKIATVGGLNKREAGRMKFEIDR